MLHLFICAVWIVVKESQALDPRFSRYLSRRPPAAVSPTSAAGTPEALIFIGAILSIMDQKIAALSESHQLLSIIPLMLCIGGEDQALTPTLNPISDPSIRVRLRQSA